MRREEEGWTSNVDMYGLKLVMDQTQREIDYKDKRITELQAQLFSGEETLANQIPRGWE
jgi:hypothetical protein